MKKSLAVQDENYCTVERGHSYILVEQNRPYIRPNTSPVSTQVIRIKIYWSDIGLDQCIIR